MDIPGFSRIFFSTAATNCSVHPSLRLNVGNASWVSRDRTPPGFRKHRSFFLFDKRRLLEGSKTRKSREAIFNGCSFVVFTRHFAVSDLSAGGYQERLKHNLQHLQSQFRPNCELSLNTH